MRSVRVALALPALAATLLAASTLAAPADGATADPGLPAGLTPRPGAAGKPAAYAGDFDGDGKPDTLQLVSVAAHARLPAAWKVSDPWQKGGALSAQGEPLALAVVHGGARPSALLVDGSYFETPIWTQAAQLPLSVVKKGTREHARWRRSVPRLAGDGIVLGTEAGIDILLYWDGKAYRVFWPEEEP